MDLREDRPVYGYRHGGNPGEDMARFGVSQRDVIDFSVSINPLGAPPIIGERWSGLIDYIRDYPSQEGAGVSLFYMERFGIDPVHILAGNGATECIYLVPRTIRPGHVLIVTPSFHDYYRASCLAGARVKTLAMGTEGLSPDNIPDEAVKGVDAVWIGRPNNPTGGMMPKAAILGLASRFPDKWFIIDEAFIQFTDDWEQETLMTGGRTGNMIVIHSLTKFYALAGLRLGAVIADRGVISGLRAYKEPWTINSVADMVARMLIGCEAYEEETRAYVSGERDRVIEALNKTKGIMAFPSTANFILCRWTGTGDLDDLLIHLLSNGIYIRDCRNFPGLEANYFRIGLRTSEEDDRLISVISSCPVD